MFYSGIFLDANAAGMQELTSTSEKLSLGFQVLGLGLATVFAVLAILWVVLLLFRVIFYREKKPEPKKAAPSPVKAPAPVSAPPSPKAEDNGALVAAITAAIAAYTEGDEEFASGFRVVSFRRAEHAAPWNKSK